MKFVKKGNAPQLSKEDEGLVRTYLFMLEQAHTGGPMPAIRVPERIMDYVAKYYKPVGKDVVRFRSRRPRRGKIEKPRLAPLLPRDPISVHRKTRIPFDVDLPREDIEEVSRDRQGYYKKKGDIEKLKHLIDEKKLESGRIRKYRQTLPVEFPENRYPTIEDKLDIDYQKVKAGKDKERDIRALKNMKVK